jgi:N-acetylglucosamine-6-phosphate deacetylase
MHIIDIHTHGIGGFDTRSNTVDDILRIAAIHGASGVSKILLSIYAAPIKAMRQQMELVRQAMEKQGHGSRVMGHGRATGNRGEWPGTTTRATDATNEKVLADPCPMPRDPCPDAGAARILGVHLEGPFLNAARCGALDPACFIDPVGHVSHELLDGFERMVKIITVAPEREGALAFIRDMVELGIVMSMGHSNATYAEAEAGFRAGARGITHLFNAMRPFHHREPGLAGFGLLNKDLYVEVLADPFHLHSRTIELIFKMKKPERVVLVSDSVKETGTVGDERVADVSGRLQGGAMTVAESAQRLIRQGFDETVVTNAITVNPRQYLMLEQ